MTSLDGWIDALIAQRRARGAAPGDFFAVHQLRKQVEFVLEQRFVLIKLEAEQREGFRERAAAEDDFGAAVGSGIDGRKTLEDADRVVGTQDRHRRSKTNAFRARSDGGEHDFRCGYGEVRAVVFTDAEEVHAELIGEYGFVDDITDDLRMREHLAVGAARDVAERVESEFKRHVMYPGLKTTKAAQDARPSLTVLARPALLALTWVR